jgi:hypothetical protein
MSAARNIPFEESLTAQNISIDSTFTPTPEGVIIGVGQPVTFTNNSGAEIASIQFQPNPLKAPSGPGPTLFTEITNLANGATSAEQPPNPTVGAVNYLITDENGKEYGPFSIQAGTAVPLKVQVIDAVIYPSTAAIPARGAAAIYSDDTPCDQYPITWASNPFTTATPTAACGFSPSAMRTGVATTGEYRYTIPSQVATGGGKIVIQN